MRKEIDANSEYQRALEDHDVIKANMVKLYKSIATAEFELLQVAESIKLAEREKEKEVMERKRLTEEYESLKVVLKEIS
ncbi:unnamed protein product [Sphagnum balticum]